MDLPFHKLYKLVEHLSDDDEMETEIKLVAEGNEDVIFGIVAHIEPKTLSHYLVAVPGVIGSTRADQWFEAKLFDFDITLFL